MAWLKTLLARWFPVRSWWKFVWTDGLVDFWTHPLPFITGMGLPPHEKVQHEMGAVIAVFGVIIAQGVALVADLRGTVSTTEKREFEDVKSGISIQVIGPNESAFRLSERVHESLTIFNLVAGVTLVSIYLMFRSQQKEADGMRYRTYDRPTCQLLGFAFIVCLVAAIFFYDRTTHGALPGMRIHATDRRTEFYNFETGNAKGLLISQFVEVVNFPSEDANSVRLACVLGDHLSEDWEIVGAQGYIGEQPISTTYRDIPAQGEKPAYFQTVVIGKEIQKGSKIKLAFRLKPKREAADREAASALLSTDGSAFVVTLADSTR